MPNPIIAGTNLSDLSRNSLALQEIMSRENIASYPYRARNLTESDRINSAERVGMAPYQFRNLTESDRIAAMERMGMAPYRERNLTETDRIAAQERMNNAIIKGQTDIAKVPFTLINPTELARIAAGVQIAGLDAESRKLIAKAQLTGQLDANEMERFRAIVLAQSQKELIKSQTDINERNVAPHGEAAQMAILQALLPSMFQGQYGPSAEQRNLENQRRQAEAAAATKAANNLYQQYKTYGRGGERAWYNMIPSVARRIPFGWGPVAGAVASQVFGGNPMGEAEARKAAADDTLKGYDPSRLSYDTNSLSFLPVPIQDNTATSAVVAAKLLQNAFPNLDLSKIFPGQANPVGGGTNAAPNTAPVGGTNAPGVVPWRLGPRGNLQ